MSKSKKDEIVNFYETMSDQHKDPIMANPNKSNHGFDIPFRACCVAPSGAGKSNWVCNLISRFCAGLGTFSTISLFVGDETEPLYKMLKSKSDQIHIYESLDKLPPLSKVDKEFSSLVIIDDMQNKKDQSRVIEYYIQCRKKNVSILYLCQNYYRCPLVVRGNCTYLIILKMQCCKRELTAIMAEKAGKLSKSQLLGMVDYATKEKFSPLIIDIESSDTDHKFRKGFTEFLFPNDYGVADS
jgi:hypothetical protein